MHDTNRTRPDRLPTVLIIEDETRMRDLLFDVLPDMGYQPIGAKTAEEGLASMQHRSVDIVLLDLNLPVMDGMTFLDRFRKDWPQTPVIIMTGFGDLGSAQRAIRHGVVDFLSKPCHLGEIDGALGRARQHVERFNRKDGLAEILDAPSVAANLEHPGRSIHVPVPTTLSDAERLLIDCALSRHNGNRSAAATELGISRRTLYNLLARYQQMQRPRRSPSVDDR